MSIGSSDKDQAKTKGRGKRKRKEYSDQDKAGELIFKKTKTKENDCISGK